MKNSVAEGIKSDPSSIYLHAPENGLGNGILLYKPGKS
jgi:hypothetical protein